MDRIMATTLILVGFATSSVCGAATADIDGSGMVDFNDLAVIQGYWLGVGPPADIAGADGNSDGVVDGLDFAVLGQNWLDDTSETIAALVTEALEFSGQQLIAIHTSVSSYTDYPYATRDDDDADEEPYDYWELRASSDWTSGYYPGCLWYLYELTGDPNYKDAALLWIVGLEDEQYDTLSHNVGFKIPLSYGHGYRLTGDPNYLPILLQAAQSYSTRFSPVIGCFHSWGEMSESEYMVTIDNTMTLEAMLWASKNGGNSAWYDMVISHAYKIIEGHVREDGTTNHRLYYDPDDGHLIRISFKPGYSADSCWSRGQAWGLYGFTVCYRETGDPNFLDTAKSLSDYFVDNLPADNVPYYDFMDPNIPNTIKDSSAASVAASGLLELCGYVSEPALQQKYFQAAKDILKSLCTRYSNGGYLAKDAVGDPIGPSILMRGYKHLNAQNKLYERGTSWGDYYFIEALMRYKNMVGG